MAQERRGRRGAGTIYWDKTRGKWRGEVSLGSTPSGRRRRPAVYGDSVAEVQDKLDALRDEAKSGVKPPGRYTVDDAVTDWIARGLDGKATSTVEKTITLVTVHVSPGLGKRLLKELTVDDIEEWLYEKREDLSTDYLRRLLSILRRAIKNAQRRNYISRNVADLAEAPKGRPGRPSKSLTKDQAAAVLRAAEGQRIYGYVVLSLLTGVRTEEARGLLWRHVHLAPTDDSEAEPSYIEVWRSDREGGGTKTKKSKRTLELPPLAIEAMRLQMAQQRTDRTRAGNRWQDHGLVFCTRYGTPLDSGNVRRAFRTVAERAGVATEPGESWVPRELRHTFVSLASAHGLPTEAIAQLVGHADTKTTELVYHHELRPVLRSGAAVMTTIFSEPEGGSN